MLWRPEVRVSKFYRPQLASTLASQLMLYQDFFMNSKFMFMVRSYIFYCNCIPTSNLTMYMHTYTVRQLNAMIYFCLVHYIAHSIIMNGVVTFVSRFIVYCLNNFPKTNSSTSYIKILTIRPRSTSSYISALLCVRRVIDHGLP